LPAHFTFQILQRECQGARSYNEHRSFDGSAEHALRIVGNPGDHKEKQAETGRQDAGEKQRPEAWSGEKGECDPEQAGNDSAQTKAFPPVAGTLP